MKKYYIAYGSNLNVQQMSMRCPDARVIGTSEIEDYQLLFKGSKSGSYLTVEPCKGAKVPVVIWSVSEEDEFNLDRYEGFPHFYYKKEMKVTVTGIKTGRISHVNAFIYIMHEERPLGIPSMYYIQTCLEGYYRFGFEPKYLEEAYNISLEVEK